MRNPASVSPGRRPRTTATISPPSRPTSPSWEPANGRTGERNEYSALQTSWADWCRENLDAEIVRGTRKEITQRQHLSPETYGAVMDKARENVRAPSEGLWDAVRDADLSEGQTEALSDLLMLKGEITRHKAQGSAYEPPKGALTLDRVGGDANTDPWPFIEAIRSGAERIYDMAHRCGVGLRENMSDRYEAGRDLFPSLSDRMHLAAVVAKCGAFMAYLKVSLVVGFVIASPVVFYQLWTFIGAGLYPHEKKYVRFYMPFSLFLFFSG